MEGKKYYAIGVGENQYMLMEKLKSLQQSFNEKSKKSEKVAKTIQVLQKELKLEKAARKSAEKTILLYSDSFEINPGK